MHELSFHGVMHAFMDHARTVSRSLKDIAGGEAICRVTYR